MSTGFVDLRQNQGQMIDESFWPSFTDIMTVVVMIFLIATSILIVKNWELVHELQTRIKVEQKISQRLKATTAAQKKTSKELLLSKDKEYEISRKLQLSLESERRTSAVVQQTSQEKASLQETLTHAQSELSLLRLQVMQARESATDRENLIIAQDKQIEQLELGNNTLQKELVLRGSQVTQAQENMALELQKQKHIYQGDITAIQREKLLLSTQLKQQQGSHKQQVSRIQQQQNSLSDEYKTLEEKYNKLVRPSRSAVGKHVVEVRYEKLTGKETIQFRSSEKEDYQTISNAVLHKKLLSLKKRYGKSLYVKIIIPDDSGLSYNEAWTFMLDLLNKYDYYYQKQ